MYDNAVTFRMFGRCVCVCVQENHWACNADFRPALVGNTTKVVGSLCQQNIHLPTCVCFLKNGEKILYNKEKGVLYNFQLISPHFHLLYDHNFLLKVSFVSGRLFYCLFNCLLNVH